MTESQASTLTPPTETASRRVPAFLFGITILLSAFLLFQVQPLIAKLILPWFGGSAAVWTSCMLFFQLALLGGYAWAHWLSERPTSQQVILHGALLLVSLAVLPIIPSVRWKPVGGEDPLLGILGLLAATVGLPYFLLSATSPLLQSWYSRANGGAMPYRFFALSNAGSMAGLLTYPILVEPYVTNRNQAWMWSIGFVAFMACFLVVAFLARNAHEAAPPINERADTAPAPTLTDKLLWIALAACASALLLAVTNHLTQNVAAIPFLWVLPLSLYLLSFILCFDSDRWYRRRFFVPLAVVELPATAHAIANGGTFDNLIVAITIFSAALFVFFMVCHGELAKRRPSSRYLTSFYLMVAIGGAIGGLLVGFVFPYVLPALIDLPIILALTAFLFAWLLWRDYSAASPDGLVDENFLNAPGDKYAIGVLLTLAFGFILARILGARFADWPAFLAAPWDGPVLLTIGGLFIFYILWRSRGAVEASDEKRDRIVMAALLGSLALFTAGRLVMARFAGAEGFPNDSWDLEIVGALAGLALLFLFWRCRDTLDNNVVVCGAAVALAFGLTGYMAHDVWNYTGGARLMMRNFYGALVVYDHEAENDWGPYRELRHGTIEHGEQFLWPQNLRHATTYYAEQSGLGLALRSLRVEGPINVGSIGLGAGTTAVYARPSDHYFFYDINPIVPFIANTQFSFLLHCYGKHEIILGDARLSLENELKDGMNRHFDLLSVDAFSGDAIPVHLLTREAFKIYWQHLQPNGVLAVHVSNRYLSLAPVVALAAKEFGKEARDINYDGNDDEQETSSEWVLVTSRPGFFDRDTIKPVAKKIEPIPGLREWTDDYSNLYKILR
ncbi:MAG TPA: hypothetical protein VG672_03175 [Bryobacteraceae bacterium]|nr:hypothetical protein [Bryobacteraceae bacterium]